MPFTVLAKSLTGAVFPITLETGTASVADLRAAIVKRLGVPLPPDALQVWYDGAPLDRAEQSMRAAGIGSGDSVVVCLGKPLPRALVRPTTTTKRSKKASDDVLDPFTPQPRLVDRMRQIIAKRQLLSDIPPDLQRLLRSVDVQEADVVSSADLHHIDPQHEYVAQLQRMGFSYSASVKALIVNMYDIERALNWLLEHSSDPDLHVPLSDVSLRRLSESDADRRDDESDSDSDDM